TESEDLIAERGVDAGEQFEREVLAAALNAIDRTLAGADAFRQLSLSQLLGSPGVANEPGGCGLQAFVCHRGAVTTGSRTHGVDRHSSKYTGHEIKGA